MEWTVNQSEDDQDSERGGRVTRIEGIMKDAHGPGGDFPMLLGYLCSPRVENVQTGHSSNTKLE